MINYKSYQKSVTIVIIIAIVLISFFKKKSNSPQLSQRIGISIDLNSLTIDPADINNINKAIISDNLYARLIADEDGQLTSWLADSFSIEKNNIILNLGEHYTSSGNLITSEDVALTLKRLIILNTNTHAKLENFLDIKNKNTVEELSSAIEITKKDQLIIHAHSKNKANLLLKILSSGEYGIIPKSAIDIKTLKIKNNYETTGAFYLVKQNIIALKKNINFINMEKSSYSDTIEIINVPNSETALDYFINERIDILPTSINLNPNMVKNLKEFNIFYTDKFKLFLIAFGPSIYNKTSALERHYLIDQFKALLETTYPFPIGTETAYQFFSRSGDGHLTDEQIKKIAQFKTSSKIHSINKKINFQSYIGLESKMKNLFKLKNLDIKFKEDFPPEFPYKERPDSYFAMGDVAFNTDYTLLSYYLESQIISIPKNEARKILNEFLNSESNMDRINLINKVHYDIIKNANIGPLFLAPYTIVTRKPFVSTQTKLSASTKLWKVINYQ